MKVRVKWKPFLYFIAGASLVIFGIGISNLNSNYVNMTNKNIPTLNDPQALWKRVDDMLNWIPAFPNLDCDQIIEAQDEDIVAKAKNWTLSNKVRDIWGAIENSTDQCKTLKEFYVFPEEPFSKEEADYPLAYGALIHKHVSQVTYMVSSLYQPQNVFVLIVDGDSDVEFKNRVDILGDCFKNIHVIHTTRITWCGYGIVRGVMRAVKYLSQLNHSWKYFQYLSGVDLPLKTNLEMVRIFKQLNGAFISEVSEYQKGRLRNRALDPPLKLFKASLSATFSRESANFMTNSSKVTDLLNFLKNTRCPDEAIWTTIAGSPEILPIPGSFNATALLMAKKLDLKQARLSKDLPFTPHVPGPGETFYPTQYYISRYQVWNNKVKCKGRLISSSCAFGVDDLPNLVRRAELVVHKLYLSFQPATYFCLLRNHWKRALNLKEQAKFSAKPYSDIAQVQSLHGVPPSELMFYRPDHFR